METRYTVRQASEMTGVKPYVMRYWEDELDFISREMNLATATTPDMIFNFF